MGDHDVFGDGAVVLKSTPGHTHGHQSLFLKLAKTGPIVLTGDLYHYAAERTMKKIPVNDDRDRTQASRDAIDTLLTTTRARLWIQHDIDANAKLKNHRSITTDASLWKTIQLVYFARIAKIDRTT